MQVNMKAYVLINDKGELYTISAGYMKAGGIKIWKREGDAVSQATYLNRETQTIAGDGTVTVLPIPGWKVARIMDVVVKPEES